MNTLLTLAGIAAMAAPIVLSIYYGIKNWKYIKEKEL